MKLKITANTEAGRKGLKQMILQANDRKAKMFYRTEVLSNDPYTVLFLFTRIPGFVTNNDTIQKMLINGLQEELQKEYGVTAEDVTIKV